MTDHPERPYSGIRLIDLSRGLGGYAARLFSDLGAEVVRVEPPCSRDGDATDAFLHAGKRRVMLDIRAKAGREALRGLVAAASVVIYDADDDRSAMLELLMGVPGPRVVTVCSYFGLTGPYAHYKGCDLVAQAMGGIAFLSGTEDGPPLRIGGGQSGIAASIYAAVATAAALWDVELRGARHLLDLSAQEAIAHSLQNAPQMYDLEQVVPRRGSRSHALMQGIFACKDGYVFLAAPPFMVDQWNDLVNWMAEDGYPGHARLRDELWTNPKTAADLVRRAEFREVFEGFLAERSRADVAGEAIRRKILIAPVNTMADLPHDPQLAYRQFFGTVIDPSSGRALTFPGAPYKMSEPVWRIGGEAS